MSAVFCSRCHCYLNNILACVKRHSVKCKSGHTEKMTEATPPHSQHRIARSEEEPEVEAIRREENPLLKAIKVIGPGVITGASDDDPSGIATYTSTGASLGFSILWMALITL